jgi:hypothetical protein
MDEGSRKRAVEKAYDLGAQYVTTWWGCAQSTFCATIGALRSVGIELITPELEEEIFPGLVGLSGGCGNMNVGSCGAITGASFAVSLAAGIKRSDQLRDKDHRWIAFDAVAETIGQRFLEAYGGLRCRDVTWSRFGKQYDSWDPAAKEEFGKDELARGCVTNARDYPCTIPRTAAWAVEAILHILERPKTLEQIKRDHQLE